MLTLFFVSILIFLLARMLGDPVNNYLDVTATAEDRALLAASMGLDKPLPVQYYLFLVRAAQGDLGRSHFFNRPVTELILDRMPNTLALAGLAFLCSVGLAIPTGVVAAVHRGRWWDWVVRGVVFFGQSMPQFWLGLMLVLLFTVTFNLLPPAGMGGPETFVLPAITLGWYSSAALTRLVRSAMLEILSSDFIRTARSKGLREITVLQRHALKNALIPATAFASVTVVRDMVMGSVVIETVFGWPGTGRLAYEAAYARDFPTIQGIVMVFAVAVILTDLLGELVYGWLDPRIRHS